MDFPNANSRFHNFLRKLFNCFVISPRYASLLLAEYITRWNARAKAAARGEFMHGCFEYDLFEEIRDFAEAAGLGEYADVAVSSEFEDTGEVFFCYNVKAHAPTEDGDGDGGAAGGAGAVGAGSADSDVDSDMEEDHNFVGLDGGHELIREDNLFGRLPDLEDAGDSDSDDDDDGDGDQDGCCARGPSGSCSSGGGGGGGGGGKKAAPQSRVGAVGDRIIYAPGLLGNHTGTILGAWPNFGSVSEPLLLVLHPRAPAAACSAAAWVETVGN